MNPKEFRKNKKPIWKENKWSYFISISAIGLGIFLQFKIFLTDWPENKGGIPSGLTELQFASLMSFPILIGLYGFWRIPAGYNFIELVSDASIEVKMDMLNKAFERIDKPIPKMNDDRIRFVYQSFFFSKYDVTILIDENRFYINAQMWEDFDGGFADLGASYRLMRKIRRMIKREIKTRDFEA